MCAGTTDNNAVWPATVAGSPSTIALGACVSGYYVVAGAPYRGCDINGAFEAVQNPCQRTCPPRAVCANQPRL